MKILCLGASFTGTFLASNFANDNTIKFLTRQPCLVKSLGFDVINSTLTNEIGTFELILDTIPPVFDTLGKLSHPYGSIIDSLMSSNPKIVYLHISSTSIYPSNFSSSEHDELPIIDEDTPANPDTKRGEVRLKLEDNIVNRYDTARIIRAGGIYGPNRSLINRFIDGNFSRLRADNKMVSRIHVMDLCRIILSFGKIHAGVRTNIVNGVDRLPSSNQETFAYIQKVTGIPIPVSVNQDTVIGRKITSKHAMALLSNKYLFPTFREGFLDCINDKD
ncbi:MAG: hypothetical protein CL880_00455 [Dehalococcoidia bacterium]|nr:hypothetical protein [Dehalococcoidia bacterium]MAX04316.1 hypothetical protein [Dehalococcoidia bacterium]